LVAVFREVRRAVRDDGTLWLNLGDSWASGKGTCYNPGGGATSLGQDRKAAGVHPLDRGNKSTLAASGLKPKDLVGIPWRVAFALQADGWWLRSDIIWHKPNPMPESVTDRPTKSHEYLFLLAKSQRYYYNAEAIAEPLASDPDSWGRHSNKDPGMAAVNPRPMYGPVRNGRDGTEFGNGKMRNKRSVWTVLTSPYREAHFATFPPALIAPCILAGCPPGGTVLDPFGGSGTTGEVAAGNGRKAILIELNTEYAKLAQDRCGLFCSPNSATPSTGSEAARGECQ
jgi:DNA modification methylase